MSKHRILITVEEDDANGEARVHVASPGHGAILAATWPLPLPDDWRGRMLAAARQAIAEAGCTVTCVTESPENA